MGAWGEGNFENDSVLDWLFDLKGPDDLRNALDAVVGAPPDASLDAHVCSAALGAAEVVVACLGHPGPDLPDEVRAWVAAHPGACDAALRALAAAAAVRIEQASELQELWDEGGRDEAWHSVVLELKERLERAS